MLLLKATERNWGLMGPGSWEKRTWKINTDGTYSMKTTYRPVDREDLTLEETREGALYEEQMEFLQECIHDYWTDEKTDACDSTAWEFKLYENDTVVRHRELGYIDGIEPYVRIAGMLNQAAEMDAQEGNG